MDILSVSDSVLTADALNEFIKEKYHLDPDFSRSLFRTGINDTYFFVK